MQIKKNRLLLATLVFAAMACLTGLKDASAYTIGGDDWSSRSLYMKEWGTSDAQASWHGANGIDMDAYAWDANSGCYASAWWTYDLGYDSGSISLSWSYHIKADFTVNGQAIAYSLFWLELWGASGGRIGASTANVHSTDIDSDRTVSETFNNLPYDRYRVVVYALVDAESFTNGSQGEADAYYGPLQVTTNCVTVT